MPELTGESGGGQSHRENIKQSNQYSVFNNLKVSLGKIKPKLFVGTLLVITSVVLVGCSSRSDIRSELSKADFIAENYAYTDSMAENNELPHYRLKDDEPHSTFLGLITNGTYVPLSLSKTLRNNLINGKEYKIAYWNNGLGRYATISQWFYFDWPKALPQYSITYSWQYKGTTYSKTGIAPFSKPGISVRLLSMSRETEGSGYEETRIDDNVFIVRYESGSRDGTSYKKRNELNLLRIADLTKQHGYTYFVIDEDQTSKTLSRIATPIVTKSTSSGGGFGSSYTFRTASGSITTGNSKDRGSNTTTTTGGETTTGYSDFQYQRRVIFYHEKPKGQYAYKAKFVYDSLVQKYPTICDQVKGHLRWYADEHITNMKAVKNIEDASYSIGEAEPNEFGCS